ncbi:MAG TPA: hypothetical protein VF773_09015 [Verrucomicrobiae bacterium]
MKRILGISVLGLVLAGCAREDDAGYVSGSAPAGEQGAAQGGTTVSEVPNTGGSATRLNSMVRTNAGPDTAVGASATASSGIGTASASGSAANESDAAINNQNAQQPSPAGTGVQDAKAKHSDTP